MLCIHATYAKDLHPPQYSRASSPISIPSPCLPLLPSSIMESEGKSKGTAMEHLTAVTASLISSKIQSYSDTSSPFLLPLPEKRQLLRLLRSFLLLFLRLLVRLLFIILSPVLAFLAAVPPPRFPSAHSPSGAAADTAAARALSHVLSVMARVPVASRKYELVRSLAERLLDDNVQCGRLEALNRAALSHAFSRTLRRLEAAVASLPGDRSLDLIVGAVRSGLRRWAAEESEVPGGSSAEKLAAELLWLAQRMAACSAAAEAVAQWGAASRLARLALSAEPRIQVAFVKVSVFLFKYANAKQVDDENVEEDKECAVSYRRMTMLTSWLPLLCRASNGADAPILSSTERAEMVRVLDETIQKLNPEQQEEVLSLWLHHFTACPDSDWPNLESCYTRWYAESRNLLLLK